MVTIRFLKAVRCGIGGCTNEEVFRRSLFEERRRSKKAAEDSGKAPVGYRCRSAAVVAGEETGAGDGNGRGFKMN